MKKLSFLFLIISFTAYAQNSGVKVFITDENIDSSTFDKKFEVQRKPIKNNSVPDRTARENFFNNFEIPKDWDELDKDMFYMDLHNKSLRDLIKKYPDYKERELSKLKDERK